MNNVECTLNNLLNSNLSKDDKIKLKYCQYLYKDISSNTNSEQLNEFTTILLDIFERNFNIKSEIKDNGPILNQFYDYVCKEKSQNTAYNYTKVIRRICNKMNLKINEISNVKTIEEIIKQYTIEGIDKEKYEENKRGKNLYSGALKKYLNFLIINNEKENN